MPLPRISRATVVHTAVSHQKRGWLGFSILICLLYGLQSLGVALDSPYVVQDDARQHIFWMQRYLDPSLFPDDLIADYFQSVAPPGYKAFYFLWTSIGINPLLISKFVPLFLGLITTLYYFGLSLSLFPVPAGAFVACLLLNQGLWMEDDLVSATPRAFLYPFFAAFLYYLLRNAVVPCLIALALLTLFYPPMALLGLGVLTLRLVRWSAGVRVSAVPKDWILWGGAFLILALVLGPYQLTTNEFGPLTTVAQAQQLPIFNQVDGYYGRAFYFHENPLIFWLASPRTGLLFWGVMSPLVLVAFALPVYGIRQSRPPLAQLLTTRVHLLSQIALAALGLYGLAHWLTFQLHFPNRYVYHGARFVLPLAAGITLTIYIGTQFRRFRADQRRRHRVRQQLGLALPLGLVAVVILLPFSPRFSVANQLYVTGQATELYQFLQQQPHATLVASIDAEANNLPTFGRRSIVAAREYALPYHWGYFSQLQRRTLAMIAAQYSPELASVQRFDTELGVDFWLVHKHAFAPDYVENNRLLKEFAQTEHVLENLASAPTPALANLTVSCARLTTERYWLLEASCINAQGDAGP
ncbi:hypothetical protein XM38_049880 [Halomicronema hongdechloris C2206]|uniref:Glycosyltransferase RgtA/B/C/D-like domain-containing protein n=1 Tax=Halomicronema hongdechloris C2206 TaxID=1641165 RepID=A0A1Z3HUM8_9CYAN|nr:hypothetical protein [Halomicronema hongdechloris]ASC74014.1 hypothetical protein XM38_049880 [Halomicronema hongdechloris C2206]